MFCPATGLPMWSCTIVCDCRSAVWSGSWGVNNRCIDSSRNWDLHRCVRILQCDCDSWGSDTSVCIITIAHRHNDPNKRKHITQRNSSVWRKSYGESSKATKGFQRPCSSKWGWDDDWESMIFDKKNRSQHQGGYKNNRNREKNDVIAIEQPYKCMYKTCGQRVRPRTDRNNLLWGKTSWSWTMKIGKNVLRHFCSALQGCLSTLPSRHRAAALKEHVLFWHFLSFFFPFCSSLLLSFFDCHPNDTSLFYFLLVTVCQDRFILASLGKSWLFKTSKHVHTFSVCSYFSTTEWLREHFESPTR